MSTRSFLDLIAEAESSPDYWKRLANLGFVNGIDRLLARMGKKRADLAALTGLPESTISRNLSGKQNLTIATMVRMAEALDAAVRIHVEKKDIRGAWVALDEMPPTLEERTPSETWEVDFGAAGREDARLARIGVDTAGAV